MKTRLMGAAFSLHMLLLAPTAAMAQDMAINDAQRNAVIDAVIEQVKDNYVFPDVAGKTAASLRQQQKRGAYKDIASARKLSEVLTEQVQALSKDKHLNVYFSEQPIPVKANAGSDTAEQTTATLARFKAMNFGIERVERLPFNIGYLDLRNFVRASAAAPALAAAMTLVANTDALIIDLRKNRGGDAHTVTLLASYLLKERTQLNSMYYREGNRTEQRWSTEAVTGERFGHDKDVYVLISKTTFSAAEDFSFAMKNLKRAMLVGESTGGGAHPGDFARLHAHFDMFIPRGRAFDPTSNTNWEDVGVTPDLPVKAEDALKTAQLAILRKIAAAGKDPESLSRLQQRIAKVQAEDTTGTMDE